MKTQNQIRNFAFNELTFIATFKSVDDNTLDHYYSETLYRAYNGRFIILCFGNANSKYGRVGNKRDKNFFYKEADPYQWLIDHNHQRLAGLLFPNFRSKIEKNIQELNLQSNILSKDEFYEFQFKNCQTKNELTEICEKANEILGKEIFWVEPDFIGHIMLPGYEDYDPDHADYFDKVQENMFSGDYDVLFEDSLDGLPNFVLKEGIHTVESVIEYYKRVDGER